MKLLFPISFQVLISTETTSQEYNHHILCFFQRKQCEILLFEKTYYIGSILSLPNTLNMRELSAVTTVTVVLSPGSPYQYDLHDQCQDYIKFETCLMYYCMSKETTPTNCATQKTTKTCPKVYTSFLFKLATRARQINLGGSIQT